MDTRLTQIAYDLIDTSVASHFHFVHGNSKEHERLIEDRLVLRHRVTRLPFEDVCRLTDALANLAREALWRIVDMESPEGPDTLGGVLDAALQAGHDQPLVQAPSWLTHQSEVNDETTARSSASADEGASAPRQGSGANSTCSGSDPMPAVISPATGRPYLTEPPSDPETVLGHPQCDICWEWTEHDDTFTRSEAAWWADWHIPFTWAPFWKRAGWTPDQVRHLLRAVLREDEAARWALTGLDPREALDHAYNGADPCAFLAHQHGNGEYAHGLMRHRVDSLELCMDPGPGAKPC